MRVQGNNSGYFKKILGSGSQLVHPTSNQKVLGSIPSWIPMDFSFFLSKAYIKFIHAYIELQREQGGVQLPQHHLLSASFSGFHLQVFLNGAMEKTLTPPSLNTTPHTWWSFRRDGRVSSQGWEVFVTVVKS